MVKNIKGGKGHKSLARKNNNTSFTNFSNIRLKDESEPAEFYAFVDKNLGNGHLYVCCDDGETRLCYIPGKFKKRKRDNLIVLNGFLLVAKYDFETVVKDKMQKCEILEVYSEHEYKQVVDSAVNNNKLLAFLQQKRSQSSQEDDGFDFCETATAAATCATAVANNDGDFDIDDI
jgi:initiation factor 1A